MSNLLETHQPPTRHPSVLRSYPAYLDALMEGDHFTCNQVLQSLLKEEVPLIDLYRGLFERSLVHVGRMWESNEISVAAEHMATAMTESLMAQVYPVLFKTERCGRRAIVSCTVNEYHQVGGKMVADLFEAHGWDSYFLGANTPLPDLLAMVEEKTPHVLCFSLALYSNTPTLLKSLQRAREVFPDLPILVGGQAFSWGGTEILDRVSNTHFLANLNVLEDWIQQW